MNNPDVDRIQRSDINQDEKKIGALFCKLGMDLISFGKNAKIFTDDNKEI